MTFKINSATGIPVSTGSAGPRRAGGDFAMSRPGEAPRSAATAQTSAALGMMGVDALLALQGEDDVLNSRRRRQVRRSHDMLDALDDLKVGVLSGEIDDVALLRLQSLITQHREDIEDDALQGLLNEIETRACVELAKRRLM